MLTLPLMKVSPKQRDAWVYAPAIPFHPDKSKQREKEDNKNVKESDKYASFDVPWDPKNEDSETTKWTIRTYESGDAEEYVKWRIEFDDLAAALNDVRMRY